MDEGFTAIVEREGAGFIATCPEVPGANGLGRTRSECLESLHRAIELIREDQREDAPSSRGGPA
jgi:predicted RNase H-like HicB family nuclease